MSEACTRFEEEGLLRVQRGEPLDDHFATCADCVKAREQYERLSSALGALPEGGRPPEGWQSRVWTLVQREEGLRRRRRFLAAGGLIGPALAAGIALVVIRGGAGGEPPFRVEVAVREAPGTVRGSSTKPGDALELTAAPGRSAHAELRVYRNDRELLWRCPPLGVDCTLGGDGRSFAGRVVLPSPGMYQVVLIGSDAGLPAPSGDLAADTAGAVRGGARVELAVPIRVF